MPVIDREKNKAYTASLEGKDHIVEGAYKRGIYEFYNGVMVEVETPKNLEHLMVNRAAAIISGNTQEATALGDKVLNQGYVIKDYYEPNYAGSTLCITVGASNPYKVGTLYYNEWQRGFDTGYFRNLRNVQNREKRYNASKKEKSRRHS